MENQDKKIRQLYTEVYGNTHASEEFKEKVITMTEKKYKKSKTRKIVCVSLAAALLAVVGSVVVSASRHEYVPVVFNGEMTKARYVDFDTGTYMLECLADNNSYCVFIHGDYNKETLYLVDYNDYFLASTDPNPTLNLYEDIDKSNYADFEEENGITYLCITDNAGTMKTDFTADSADGETDGNINGEVYTLLPNGSVVNTIKAKNVGSRYMSVWDNIYELMGREESK